MNPIWISCCLHLIWCGAPAVIELFGLFYLQKLANFFPISRFFSVPHFPQEISRSLISRFPSGNVHLYTWQSFKKGSHFSVGHFLSILSTLKKQHSWRLCRVDVFMDLVKWSFQSRWTVIKCIWASMNFSSPDMIFVAEDEFFWNWLTALVYDRFRLIGRL